MESAYCNPKNVAYCLALGKRDMYLTEVIVIGQGEIVSN